MGNAVVRNRLRRRLRAAVRERGQLLRPATAYLVSASPGARDMSHGELVATVERLLRAAEPS